MAPLDDAPVPTQDLGVVCDQSAGVVDTHPAALTLTCTLSPINRQGTE